jgi:dihydroneopterin aldolase
MYGMIGIENHKIHCILGDTPEEQSQEQDLFVDFKVEADFYKTAQTDDLADTVDYVALAKICTDLATKRRYRMMETFAFEVIQVFLRDFPVRKAWVRIKKPAGLFTADFTFVELEGVRE